MDAHSTHTHTHIDDTQKQAERSKEKRLKTEEQGKTRNVIVGNLKYVWEKNVLCLINRALDFCPRYSADKRGWRRPAVSFSGKQ